MYEGYRVQSYRRKLRSQAFAIHCKEVELTSFSVCFFFIVGQRHMKHEN